MPWRDSALTPRILGLDARCLIPWATLFFHVSMLTFWFAAVGTAAFWLLERRGYTPEVVLRIIRCFFAGSCRPVIDRAAWRRRARW